MKLRISVSKLYENEYSNTSEQAIYGSIINIIDYGFKVLFQLLSTVILARLLTPDDFGLISMSLVIINFVAIFKDAGLSMATIQKKQINKEVITSLFWINLILSIFLSFLVAISAPVLAFIYGRKELIGIVILMSVNFLINGVVIQHIALIRRKMMFLSLSVTNFIAQVISLSISIILAINGFRYWSLVIGSVLSTIVYASLILIFCPWIPGKYKKHSEAIDFLKTGGYVSGFNLLNYFSRNLDYILIGKMYGATSLGLYSRAYQIVLLPLISIREPITAVALPALSRVRDNIPIYKQYFRHFTSVISIISMPIMAFVYLSSYELIVYLFGENWIGMLSVFKVLTIAGFAQAPLAIKGIIMISSDKPKEYFYVGMISTLITVIGITIGSFWGIKGVAIGYTVSFYLAQLPTFKYIFSVTNIDLKDLVFSVYPSFIASILSAFIVAILCKYVAFHNILFTILCKLIFVFVIYLLVLLLIKEGREQVYSFKKVINLFVRKRGENVC